MSLPRPRSQASRSSSSSKPSFQKKFKPRNRGLSNIDEQFNLNNSNQMNFSTQVKNLPSNEIRHDQFTRSQYPSESDQQQRFLKTVNKLETTNFQNHCSETCVCAECSCGRHLCKFSHNIKPDLSKNTIYKKDFMKKPLIQNHVLLTKDHDKLAGPHLDMNSTQRKSFIDKEPATVEKPRPDDQLKTGGPSPNMTTYKFVHPGFKGVNQYVKPTDKHVRANFPLRSKSSYSNNFGPKNYVKDDYKYMDDQLKLGGKWLGKSSYGNFFENPNPEYHAKKVKLVDRFFQNPKFAHQYQTVYKNDFIPKDTPVCAAKILIETRKKGNFSASKSGFIENSDFKAMSPTYHAFSTSRHSFA